MGTGSEVVVEVAVEDSEENSEEIEEEIEEEIGGEIGEEETGAGAETEWTERGEDFEIFKTKMFCV